ncbi:DUF7557 family protein [Haloarcula nitratireducens]|uniref:Uncharacterized protein n=1 Tax=Haloarcula nitratireducens TaxID=2487749 RepID=A0AAW4PJP6_9EURY|nr:hypothetical protein [Halomicroarcula nitratireducens]MBX0298193.1 hypothetical protein [Halomicroarcula nitratireducens]
MGATIVPTTIEINDELKVQLESHLKDDETIEDFIGELLSQYESDRTFLQEGYSK